MKQVKRVCAMLLCVATVLSLCMTFAVAANQCSETEIKGDVNNTATFYITTKNKWRLGGDKITLTATAGLLHYDAYSASDVTGDVFGFYEVTWYKKSGNTWKYVSSKTWDNTSECPIKNLKKSTEYKITVRPYTIDEIYEKHRIAYANNALCPGFYVIQKASFGAIPQEGYDNFCKPQDGHMYWDSESFPTWTVSATSKGIMTCSK